MGMNTHKGQHTANAVCHAVDRTATDHSPWTQQTYCVTLPGLGLLLGRPAQKLARISTSVCAETAPWVANSEHGEACHVSTRLASGGSQDRV